jgi:outer membrane receptor protein involved in Fe transport
MNKQFRTTAIHRGVVQLVLLGAGGAALAQTAAPATPSTLETVVVTGQRKALETALERKKNADEIVDSIDADDLGRMPDKSISEVLQRVVGVTVQRQRTINNDATHFSDEGSGIRIRGLGWGISTLNGREIFSAGWPGKELSWGAVTPELTVGVDVYKNPSAENIEGAVSGITNIRTGLPFDYGNGATRMSFGASYADSSGKFSPQVSGLYAKSWDSDFGRVGVLVDLATNQSTYANEFLDLKPYFPRTDISPGRTVYIPQGASWGTSEGTSRRNGFYGALQWKKNDKQSALTYFLSKGADRDIGSNLFVDAENGNLFYSVYHVKVDNAVISDTGAVTSARYSYPLTLGKKPDGTVDDSHAGKGAAQFAEGGIPTGGSRSVNDHTSQTAELAWNFKWALSDRLGLQLDAQWVNSKLETKGNEIQLGTFIPSMDIALNGNNPVQFNFDDHTREFLANPDNWYWNFIQPIRVKADANLYAVKADVKYTLDHPILRDIRAGWRTSYRNAYREQATFLSDSDSSGWQSIANPWDVRQTRVAGQPASPTGTNPDWAARGNFGFLKDYPYPTELHDFKGIVGGRFGNLPSAVFPTYDLMKDYPNAYNQIMSEVRFKECMKGVEAGYTENKNNCYKVVDGVVQTGPDGQPLSKYVFDGELRYGHSLNGNRISKADLWTHALYTNLRFGFEDWAIPVEGNVGVRAALVSAVSHGSIKFEPTYDDRTPPDLPRFTTLSEPLDVKANHVDLLPSLNLKASFTDKLIGRLAMAQSVYRPDFKQMQESITLKQEVDFVNSKVNYTGENRGNTGLKPLKADSVDLTLEWYPKPGQSLTAGVFYKKVKDLVYTSTYTRTFNSEAGNPQIFLIKGPANMAYAEAAGIEISGSTYLDRIDFLKDKLPDFLKGIGFSANYSYVDSRQSFYRNAKLSYCPAESSISNPAFKAFGCDTNGLPYDNLPMQGMAKNASNVAINYDRGRFSMRLAYTWNARVFAGLTEGGYGKSADPARLGKNDAYFGLPIFREAYGQWDGGMSYGFTDKFGMSLSVSNLNKVMVRETVQQAPGTMGQRWRFPGHNYYVSGWYSF